jgi:polyisoprenoid-binding protein YceI
VPTRAILSCAGTALLLSPAFAQQHPPTVYEIRPEPQQRFALEVFKSGLWEGRKHVFLFSDYSGVVHYDQSEPENSTIELTIEGASAACQDTWVNESDRRKIQDQAFKMMDVPKHSHLLFTSRQVIPLGGGRFQVKGSLEIRGIAAPVTLEVTLGGTGPDALDFQGNARVLMGDYSLKPPGAALGLIGTKNEMRVAFELRAKRNP